MYKITNVRELIAKLQECDLDADIWVSTNFKDASLDRSTIVVGIGFDDDDSGEAREIGRKKYGTDYLRIPVLIIEQNWP